MNTEHTPFDAKNIKKISAGNFSHLLQNIADPPVHIYVCGNTDLLKNTGTSVPFKQTMDDTETRYLCIVGSRRYTSYGEEACKTLVKSLEGLPVVIVSGLALGIDGIAHRAALSAGLKTIAVPGSGIDPESLYPRSHFYLAEDILNEGGLLLSEYAPGTKASPWSFPMRNRIMAGLSHAVLIIEAEEDSGTLITARMALDYNRDVGVIPGSIFSANSRGTNDLLSKGATPITNEVDLKRFLGFSDKAIGIENDILSDNSQEPNALLKCSDEEIKVIDLLREPLTRNEIQAKCSMTISELQVVISMLEIRGIITESFGKISLKNIQTKRSNLAKK